MEGRLDGDFEEAKNRLNSSMIKEMRESLRLINNYTSFNSIGSFTPKQVEVLLNHIDKCHAILWPLSEVNDYELPYRVPPLAYQARELRKSVS